MTRSDSDTHSPMVALGLQALAEFYGMFIFLFLSFAGVQSGILQGNNFLEISLVFGLGLAVAVWLTYRISGGALNPAVNLGLLIAGCMGIEKFIAYTIAQMLGATAAAGVVRALFNNPLGKSGFLGANQIQVVTINGVAQQAASPAQAFFIEALLTMGLVLVVFFVAVEKSRARFMAPLLIGLYVFIAHIISIPYTNTSINPARSFGASVVAGVWNDHWIFWAGPFAGAALAAGIYKFFKAVDYESLNPGQEDDGYTSAV